MHQNKPKRTKHFLIILILLIVCIGINWYSQDEMRVEKGYYQSFYPGISSVLRAGLGWIPFSVGDFLYGALIVYLLYKIFAFFRWIKRLVRKQDSWNNTLHTFRRLIIQFLMLYIIFNIFWGINYNRVGIAGQLKLEIKEYSIAELKEINAVLVSKINSSKQALLLNKEPYLTNKQLFSEARKAYDTIQSKYSFLKYNQPSLKSSMWGWVGNYTGFTGYYNPFTGEAQVNTTVPKFTQPFTTCHEVAHQLGYAKEMEANFVGYLAASASGNNQFQYSVYTDLFTYANRSLYFADSTAALNYRKILLPEVKVDFLERRKFNEKHRSFVEPIIAVMYGKFLESNRQPMGLLSYDEVTSFIIAYYKKFNTI